MSKSDYHGFVSHEFRFEGLDAVVVEPKTVAPGRPWIWRAEFFDHRPQLDLALLERGYHLVHLAVGNTFGAPGPMSQFSHFYASLTSGEWKLNRRVILEGFSRGGLYAYNWGIKNPSKVMAIYGDAPVCDFKTWPYGANGGKASPDDWKQLIQSYGFPSQAAALDYRFNPVDCLAPLAAAHVPLIHVVGDADEVVPVLANTAVVEQRYRALGGTIEVIHKPGGLHHPHSLDDPKPLVEFLTKHADDSKNAKPSTEIAAPNGESRYTSAGWGNRSWYDQFEDGRRAASKPDAKLVLLGDSITQGFGGPDRQVYGGGAAAYATYLAPLHAANLGISGDRTQHVLWRVENGAIDQTSAKVIAVMIGINNYPDDTPTDVQKGIQAIVKAIRRHAPKAKIVVQPIMPSGMTATEPMRLWSNELNARLAKTRWSRNVFVFAPHDYLLNADGSQNRALARRGHLLRQRSVV